MKRMKSNKTKNNQTSGDTEGLLTGIGPEVQATAHDLHLPVPIVQICGIKRRVTEGMNAIKRNTCQTAKTAAHGSKSIRAQMN
jgi:hypothetical protein